MQLRLSVVDDPAIAAAIARLRGEWHSQTGAEYEVTELSEKGVLEAESLSADALICPTHLLAVLAEHGILAAVPQRIARDKSWGDLFELLRLREATWGGQIMAVPFGSPVFCCYYRADLLERIGRRPPRTWAEYHELARLLADAKPADATDWCGAIEPLGPSWAGLALLARAAPYAKHKENYSTLFDIETMKPLIAGPPFIQALEELVADAKYGPTNPTAYDPASVRAAFWQGQCGLALTWPTAADLQGLVASTTSIQVGFIQLPGSRRVFNLSTQRWDNRAEDEDQQVPLLGIAGRLGVVSAKSAQSDAAFQLLLWLSDSQMSVQVSPASPSTTMFRQSHLSAPSQWVEKTVSAAAAMQYAEATSAALRCQQWLGALFLPGREEYLAALDGAVTAAVAGKQSPDEALHEAQRKWGEITERLGLQRQRAAYRRSLGLP